jgi:hypothetical protein
MAKEYSKKAVMGFVGSLSIILIIILFAVTGTPISQSLVGICLVIMLILISLTSLVLGVMSILECQKNPELKGKYLGLATIILSLLFIIFIILIAIQSTTVVE